MKSLENSINLFYKLASQEDNILKLRRQIAHFENGGDLDGKEISKQKRYRIIESLRKKLFDLEESEINNMASPSIKEIKDFIIEIINDVINTDISISNAKNIISNYLDSNFLKESDLFNINENLTIEQEQVFRTLME